MLKRIRSLAGSTVALLLAAFCSLPCAARAQAVQPAARQTYLEFGTVVALGKRDVEVQTSDPRLGRMVQRSFTLTRETRADVVHVGDTVEMIYFAEGEGAGDLVLERLVTLHSGVPKIGPAPARLASTAPANRPQPGSQTGSYSGSQTGMPAIPARRGTTLGRTPAAAASASPTTSAPGLGGSSPGASSASGAQPVTLGSVAPPRVPGVVSVPLGGPAAITNPTAPRVKTVTQQAVGEQCNRTADWPAQPISLAVLDFRYPTEREEAHDVGSTGGGSGTAVADLVYRSLERDPAIVLSRGDRQKLFRMDFAGAARVGRQLGVDLVLLGTFAPVEIANADPDFPPATQAYTLRAGIVETCTGQLLYRLSSITCPATPAGTVAPSCPGSEITAREAADPQAKVAAFTTPIANLLEPFEHGGTPLGLTGTAGEVSAAGGGTVSVRLASGATVQVGDQLGVHSYRMSKNPTTNTVEVFHGEEIGRITVSKVAAGTATGSYIGDVFPRTGDTTDLITR